MWQRQELRNLLVKAQVLERSCGEHCCQNAMIRGILHFSTLRGTTNTYSKRISCLDKSYDMDPIQYVSYDSVHLEVKLIVCISVLDVYVNILATSTRSIT